jgi:hypothetical protein
MGDVCMEALPVSNAANFDYSGKLDQEITDEQDIWHPVSYQ